MDYDALIREARSYIGSHQIPKAISLLERLEQENPYKGRAFDVHSYVILRYRRQYATAAQIAELGLQTNPDNISLKRTLAEALSHIPGEGNRAEECFEELLRDYPDDFNSRSTYADFLVRRGQYGQAREIYQSLLASKLGTGKLSRVRIDYARSYRLDHKAEEGLTVLDQQPMPDDPYWLREKGNCLIELGQGEQANNLFTRARQLISGQRKQTRTGFYSRLEPLEKAAEALCGRWEDTIDWVASCPLNALQPWAKATVWRAIRMAIERQGDIEGPFQLLLDNLRRFPEEPELAYAIDRLATTTNLPEERCREIAYQALELAPNNPSVLEMVARYDSEKALPVLERAWQQALNYVSSSPRMVAKISGFYAYLLRQSGNLQDALSILEHARTEIVTYEWELEFERAICLSRLGNYRESVDILLRLNKHHPNTPVILDQLGSSLRAAGRLKEALGIYKKKLAIQDDIPGKQGLGRTLYALGQYEEAQQIFEDILRIDPDDAEAKFHLASIVADRGDLDHAQQMLSEISPIDLATRGRELVNAERTIAELDKRFTEQQAELEQAQRLVYLGTMATATAHELNQPIGIIRALTDSALSDLRSGLLSQEEIGPLLEKILAQTERLAGIINNLRAFARGDRTKRERVNLNDLVEQITQMFVEQFKHRDIEFEVHTKHSDPQPIAWANPVQLEEVLINLLTNARDAVEGRPDAKICVVSWRHRSGSGGFSVEDNGPGVTQEYKAQMFVPFVSTKSTEKGTGLGLFISRRLISDLGGRLFYEDVPSGGARFVVHLPPVEGD